MKRILLLSVVFLMLAAQVVWGQIPQTISYQGVLTDASGNIVPDGDYSLTFKLYDGDENELWSESHPAVAVSDGVFSVILGKGDPPNSLNLSFDEPYWLGITVGPGSELTPRIELTSSAYSLHARSIADSAVTSAKIRDGTIVNADISGTAGILDTKLSGTGTLIASLNADMIDGKNASELGGQVIYDAVVDISGNGDYTDIGSAIAEGKKKLFIKEGTYTLTADIALPDGTLLQGADWNATEVTGINTVSGGSNIVIKDMKFTNAGSPGPLQMTGSYNLFEHIKIDVSSNFGISSGRHSTIVNCHIACDIFPVYTGNNSVIRDNYLDGRGGTECHIGANSLITGNEIHNSGDNDGAILAGENCAIINNWIISSVTQNLGIRANIRARIIGNYIERFQTGIYFHGGDGGAIIQGNIVKDCGNVAYKIATSYNDQNYVEVIGNVAYNPGGGGFYLEAGGRVMVNGNQVYNAEGDGFYINSTYPVQELTISNNAARDCSGVGFNLSGSYLNHEKWNIIGNQAVRNDLDGFRIDASDASICGNIARENSGMGFNFQHGLRYSSFTGNTSRWNGSYGFYASAINQCSISGNVIKETFYIDGQLTSSTIVGNVLPAEGNHFGSQTNSVVANNAPPQ